MSALLYSDNIPVYSGKTYFSATKGWPGKSYVSRKGAKKGKAEGAKGCVIFFAPYVLPFLAPLRETSTLSEQAMK